MQLVPNVGNGLKIDENGAVTVDYDETYIHSDSEGLYVDDLDVGNGTICDGWTILPGNPASNIDTNTLAISFIFSFGLYKPASRSSSGIVYSQTIRSASDIIDEINAPIVMNSSNYTSYHPNQGELIQLITNPISRTVYDRQGVANGSSVETGNRSSSGTQETKAIFCIMDIAYMNTYKINTIDLICIYSSIPDFVVGNHYTGTHTDSY